MERLSERIFDSTEGHVFSGPFSEMKLVRKSVLASRAMWIIGCYEQELEAALCDLITNPPTCVVDIGSAHGYYTVGLATKIDGIPLIGFEQAVHCWEQARALAELNGVAERILQKGFCDVGTLRNVLKNDGAVICDCEGGELEILRPEECPALKTSRIICEVHDFYRPDVTSSLVSRFKDTHQINMLVERSRNPDAYRVLDGFSNIDRCLAVKESKHVRRRKTSAKFLWMIPKTRPQNNVQAEDTAVG